MQSFTLRDMVFPRTNETVGFAWVYLTNAGVVKAFDSAALLLGESPSRNDT